MCAAELETAGNPGWLSLGDQAVGVHSFLVSNKAEGFGTALNEAESSNESEDLFYFRHKPFHSGEWVGLPPFLKVGWQLGV